MIVVLTSTRSRGGARLFFRVAAMAYCSTESSGARRLVEHTTGAEARASLVSLLPRDARRRPRHKTAKKAAPLPPRRRAGPRAPRTPRRDVLRAAACNKCEAAYSQSCRATDGLRRPQRRRAHGRRGDARDLRDVRVSSQPAAAAEQKTRLRCGGRRDRPLRHLGPGRWSFLRPDYRVQYITACPTSGDVCIRHQRTTSHSKKVGRQ